MVRDTKVRAIATATCCVVLCEAGAQTFRYRVTPIANPLVAANRVFANAINNRGEVVGVAEGSPNRPILFRPGIGTTVLPVPTGYSVSTPTDINDAGVIVGYCLSSVVSEEPRGWKYENGQFSLFPVRTFAHAINNSGVVAGRGCWTSAFTPYFGCYFSDAPGDPAPDTYFGSANSYPVSEWRFADINDAGDIAFTAVSTMPGQVRNADGSVVSITGPTAPYVRSFVWGLNNSRQVIARWEYNVGSQYYSRGFIWSEATGAQVIGIPGLHVRPKGINNLGHVVGESGGNQNSYLDMWLWTPAGGNEDLEPLVDPAEAINLVGVGGINDAGQILVRGLRLNQGGANVTCILTPVVPPCSADFNRDGVLDFFDYLDFVVAFSDNLPSADFDGDGVVDLFDYLDFVAAFSAGC